MTDAPHPENPSVFRLLGKFWTPANGLSLLRLILVFPIAHLIYIDGPLQWQIALILLAGMTDFFDGRLARRSHTVSAWGKVLDPLADKLMGISVVLALVIRPAEPNLPMWLLILLFARDLSIVVGGILVAKRRGYVVMSAMAGKLAVTALAVTVVLALIEGYPRLLQWSIYVSAAMLAYSYVIYLIRYFRWMRGEEPPEDANDRAERLVSQDVSE